MSSFRRKWDLDDKNYILNILYFAWRKRKWSIILIGDQFYLILFLLFEIVYRNNLVTSCIYVREYTLGRALIARACSRGSLGRVWVIWLLWCVSVQGWRVARDVFTVCPVEYLWFAVLDCSGNFYRIFNEIGKELSRLETSREISEL